MHMNSHVGSRYSRTRVGDRNRRRICPVYSSHPPLTRASRISKSIFLFDSFWYLFPFRLMLFCLLVGGLGSVPWRHCEGPCTVAAGGVGEGQWLQIGCLESSGPFAVTCWKSSHSFCCPTMEVPTVSTVNNVRAREETPHTKQLSRWEVQALLCRCLFQAKWGVLVRRSLHCLPRVVLLGANLLLHPQEIAESVRASAAVFHFQGWGCMRLCILWQKK